MLDPNHAAITAVTLDPERRMVLYHLAVETEHGTVAALLPFSLPMPSELAEVLAETDPGEPPALDPADPGPSDLDHERRKIERATEPSDARVRLATALRRLADYLQPVGLYGRLRTEARLLDDAALPDFAEELDALAMKAESWGLTSAELPDYGPAGQGLVIERLEDDLEAYGEDCESGERVATVALVLREIMEGRSPAAVLADYGLLDG